MPKFRKKPVVIEAILWDNTNEAFSQIRALAYESYKLVVWDGDTLLIPTLEGDMKASKGDWIIGGVKDEIYPCKPDIFEKTYEAIDD